MPSETLAEADRLAKELDRSRSWVVAEAIRRYAAAVAAAEADAGRPAEPQGLRADLRRSPAERLRRAEGLAHAAPVAHRTGAHHLVLGFNLLEEFLAWKANRAADLAPNLAVAKICGALNDAGARYLLIGEVAGILHGAVRGATHLDILIECSEQNAKCVLAGLTATGRSFARPWLDQELLRRSVIMIGGDPGVAIHTTGWWVDYDGAIARATAINLNGVTIPLANIEDLIASKRINHPQEAADAELLETIQRYQATA